MRRHQNTSPPSLSGCKTPRNDASASHHLVGITSFPNRQWPSVASLDDQGRCRDSTSRQHVSGGRTVGIKQTKGFLIPIQAGRPECCVATPPPSPLSMDQFGRVVSHRFLP
ncbi:hypothetical protein CGRA01v4_00440 [Colletotrichum graminicola]|nr:hypothetical protein CGRA01v4_00440 [Colletotrichum graminicola]